MRYFVTGATGFIGGKLARELVKRGHQVVTVARTPAKASDLAALGVAVVKGDITDKESMRASMTGVDGVYHVAGWYKVGVRDKSDGVKINVEGTRNVLELMRELAIPKGVYTSTLAIYGDTKGVLADESTPKPVEFDTEYDRTKAAAHFDVALPMMRAGLPLVIVQPGMVYGPDDTSQMREGFWIPFLQRTLPMLPQGATYAWAHVDDIVEGHILAMERGKVGETYIIAGEVMKLTEAADLAARLTGVPAPSMRPSSGMVELISNLAGVVDRMVPLSGQYSVETLRSLNASYIGSNAKAKRDLGYTPRPLEVGLKETLAHEMGLLKKAN